MNSIEIYKEKVDSCIKSGMSQHNRSLKLSESDKSFLLNVCRIVLTNYFRNNDISIKDFYKIPANLLVKNYKLYVSLYDKNGKIKGCIGSNKGNLLASAIEATKKAIQDKRFGGLSGENELNQVLIDIVVVGPAIAVKNRDLRSLSNTIELGVHAISINDNGKVAFFKNTVPVMHGYDLETTLEQLCKDAKIDANAYKRSNVKLHIFSTLHFKEVGIDGDNRKVVDNLWRNNVIGLQSTVTKSSLEESLQLMLTYFKNHTNKKGELTYLYTPRSNKIEQGTKSPHILRIIASIWMFATAGIYFKDTVGIEKAKLALNFILDNYYHYSKKDDFGYIKVNRDANLGHAGFTVCAILAIGDHQFDEHLKKITNFILAMENRKKGFLYPSLLPDKEFAFKNRELYFPGEALTGLSHLYDKTGDKKYLGVLKRTFDYYKELFNRTQRASMGVWMSKSYGLLYKSKKKKKYADFLFDINDYIVNKQKNVDPRYIDKIGSFSQAGYSHTSAVFLESICEALAVAKMINDQPRIKAYTRAIYLGLRYIQQCQYSHDRLFNYPNRGLVLGGVRTSLYSNNIRIDNVAHCTCALLKALQLLNIKY